MSKQLSITSLLANKTTGKTTPRIPLVVQPAARPKLGRPPKRPLQEGQQAGPQQEQPPLKRARKGQSTGKWRESQQYGLTPTLLALFPWAASVEGEGLEVFCECLVCSDFKGEVGAEEEEEEEEGEEGEEGGDFAGNLKLGEPQLYQL